MDNKYNYNPYDGESDHNTGNGEPGTGNLAGEQTGTGYTAEESSSTSYSAGSNAGSSISSSPGTETNYRTGSSYSSSQATGTGYGTGSSCSSSQDTGSSYGTGSSYSSSQDTGSSYGAGSSYSSSQDTGSSYGAGSSYSSSQATGTGYGPGSSYSSAQDAGGSYAAGGDTADSTTKQSAYDFYEVNHDKADDPITPEPPRKEKKLAFGMGKRFGICITMALVFGLVAGLVFQGVNVVGKKYFGTGNNSANVNVPTVQMQSSANNDNAGDDTSAEATPLSTGTYSVVDIAKNVMPSVVAITAVSVQEVQDFFGGTQEYEGVGSGSGIIIGQNDDELLIATNNHVVEDSKNLSVSFYGDDVNGAVLNSESSTYNEDMNDLAEQYAENSVAAQIKGTDSENDLAVIAVQKSDIPEETMNQIKIATMGDSDSLEVGEQVVAIGNALGYGQSVTSGYISALNRTIDMEDTADGLIQTDAAINPGNSGGALLNMKGEVIGINSAKFADETVEGMGFAIPIATAQPILDDLMNRETRSIVDDENAAYMGVSCIEVSSEAAQMYNIPTGVYVGDVEAGGAAEQAGIMKGDVITAFAGTKVTSYDELTNQLQYYAAGEEVEVTIQRANNGQYEEQTVTMTLGSRPADN